jgi:cytochrome P450
MLNLYAYHNNPKIWSNPREFNINRWLGEEREKSMDNFIGFGTGPRSCIGKDLAWAELFLVLANLIRNFDMELVDKELTAQTYFMYKPKLGRMNVALTPRV